MPESGTRVRVRSQPSPGRVDAYNVHRRMEWERCCLAGEFAPFALQRVADASTIDSNATAIPVGGSLCGKAYCFQQWAFLFSGCCTRSAANHVPLSRHHNPSPAPTRCFFCARSLVRTLVRTPVRRFAQLWPCWWGSFARGGGGPNLFFEARPLELALCRAVRRGPAWFF